MSNALQLVTGDIYNSRESFMRVLADRSINFEREAGFAIQIMQNNDYALKVAAEQRQSIVDAVTNIAAIGISLNPAKKQAYLVPRGGRICLDISYIGLLDIAISSGSIRWGQAEIVRKNDVFRSNGFDKAPTHEFDPFSTERGDIVGTYVVVKTADGDYLTTTMTLDECNKIRDRSDSWRNAKPGRSKGPWETDPGEMMKKTVIKRAYKLWPKTDRLDQAIHHLNTDGGEGIDFKQEARGADWIDVEPLIAQVRKTTTDADALACWRANNAKLLKQKSDYERFKSAVMEHRTALQESNTVDVAAREVPETAGAQA